MEMGLLTVQALRRKIRCTISCSQFSVGLIFKQCFALYIVPQDLNSISAQRVNNLENKGE